MTEKWEQLYSKALKSVTFENPSLVQQLLINTAIQDGIRKERERISNYIEENRTYVEVEAGIGFYRDHFDSKSLLKFINTENDESLPNT